MAKRGYARGESPIGGRKVWNVPSLTCHPGEAIDGLERAVGLQDREEHMIGALILSRPIGQLDATEVERLSRNGIEQLFPCRLAIDPLQRLDQNPADQIAFERHKARLQTRILCRQRALIRCYKRQ